MPAAHMHSRAGNSRPSAVLTESAVTSETRQAVSTRMPSSVSRAVAAVEIFSGSADRMRGAPSTSVIARSRSARKFGRP